MTDAKRQALKKSESLCQLKIHLKFLKKNRQGHVSKLIVVDMTTGRTKSSNLHKRPKIARLLKRRHAIKALINALMRLALV